MDDTIVAPAARISPLSHRTPDAADRLLDGALRCAEDRHWDVFPGTWLIDAGGTPRCSCGHPACAAPGAHPAEREWSALATGSAVTVRRLWARQPLASVLLPTGRTFDALDVPETAGCLALARLERMGVPLGPVLSTPARRVIFFVLPGSAVKIPAQLRRLGWSPTLLDLVVRSDGDYVAAPPTRVGTSGRAQWVREPTPANRWLPDANSLLSPLAYAVGSVSPSR